MRLPWAKCSTFRSRSPRNLAGGLRRDESGAFKSVTVKTRESGTRQEGHELACQPPSVRSCSGRAHPAGKSATPLTNWCLRFLQSPTRALLPAAFRIVQRAISATLCLGPPVACSLQAVRMQLRRSTNSAAVARFAPTQLLVFPAPRLSGSLSLRVIID